MGNPAEETYRYPNQIFNQSLKTLTPFVNKLSSHNRHIFTCSISGRAAAWAVGDGAARGVVRRWGSVRSSAPRGAAGEAHLSPNGPMPRSEAYRDA